jgi:hypothetical protein
MTAAFNPRSAALAFRIWRYAEPLGWDCTVAEIADELRESTQTVNNICWRRGWNRKLRTVTRTDGCNNSTAAYGFSEAATHSIARYRRLAEESPE